ncbi:MAG: hypothetical protein HRT45_14595 [Bdellovibrionales bacterium]|nr:hypothetical protein [Bdellovibrionales bacterium]
MSNVRDFLYCILMTTLCGCAGDQMGAFDSAEVEEALVTEIHDQNRSPDDQDPDSPADQKRPNPTPPLPPISGKTSCRADGLISPNLYSTSVAEYLIIRDKDATAFTCLRARGVQKREIPRSSCDDDSCLVTDAYIFDSHYSDGTEVELQVEKAKFTTTQARGFATKVAEALGRIPSVLRKGVREGKIQSGPGGAYADVAKFFIATEYIDSRIEQKKLAHTMFHEAVHAVWEDSSLSLNQTSGWLSAQASDNCFVTSYAQRRPAREDMAETALLAFAVNYYPERLPQADLKALQDQVPGRLKFLSDLLPKKGESLFVKQGAVFRCN